MFSIDHFKYLLRSNRYFILLVFLISVLNMFIGTDAMIVLESLLCGALAYILPVLVFYHVHDKRAVDSYLCLPLSRKRMLLTDLAYIFALIGLPLSMMIIVFGIRSGVPVSVTLICLLQSLIGMSALVLFNTLIYLLANNVFDGVIMMGAYTVFPIVLATAVHMFTDRFVCGGINFAFNSLTYLSPVYLCGTILEMLYQKRHAWRAAAVLAVYAVVCFVLLYRSYKYRKFERAGTTSNGLFTYPVVISAYLMAVLLCIVSLSSFGRHSMLELFMENIALYILLFAVFVAVNFIYRRKLYFNVRLALVYLAALVLSLTVGVGAMKTDGYGLADRYIRSERTYFSIDIWQNDDDDSLSRLVKEKTGKDSEYVNMHLQIGDSMILSKISQESYDYIDKLRQAAIRDFYDPESDSSSTGNLYVVTYVDKDRSQTANYALRSIDHRELLAFAQKEGIEVEVDLDSAAYVIKPGGVWVLLYEYE